LFFFYSNKRFLNVRHDSVLVKNKTNVVLIIQKSSAKIASNNSHLSKYHVNKFKPSATHSNTIQTLLSPLSKPPTQHTNNPDKFNKIIANAKSSAPPTPVATKSPVTKSPSKSPQPYPQPSPAKQQQQITEHKMSLINDIKTSTVSDSELKSVSLTDSNSMCDIILKMSKIVKQKQNYIK
jgi:hypothetical protein